MKIVETDNFGRDYPNEKVVAHGIPHRDWAECMADALNERFAGQRFYFAAEDNYELQPGFQP